MYRNYLSQCELVFRALIIVTLSLAPAYGQSADTTFRHPLDIPTLLSGTFAELRANHFHSGIDFRTQGVTGHKVYACERGYISRIFVSPAGYGNAVYITHANGYSTVYAHLEKFNDEIAQYVKEQQYKRESFRIDLYPDSTRFTVKRGQVIGFSGNTGSSGGPHLHFEVRLVKTEEPINPLLFGFGVKDNIAPIIRRLAVYPMGEGSTVNGSAEKLILPLEKSGKTYRIAGNKKLTIHGKVAFGIDTYDLTYGSANKCGPYHMRLLIDSLLFFSQTMDKFSFDETRYLNSLIDYAYYEKHRNRFNRLYIEPNNRLRIYDQHIDRGVVSFNDSAAHRAQVLVRDFHGNTSKLDFSFVYNPDQSQVTSESYLPEFDFISDFMETNYKKELIYKRPGIKVTIPANTLYDHIGFEYRTSEKPTGKYSALHHIHHADVPLHKAITIEVAADSLPERLQANALLARLNNGRWESAGGSYTNGIVKTDSRLFGDYAIAVDTVAPRIVPINIKKGANIQGIKNIRFKITDDFSGIGSYNGWIDGQWVLFEYDAKNNVIYYNFDSDRITKNKKHVFQLKVADGKGNTAAYNTEFTW